MSKYIAQIIASIAFFLIVQTSYFWQYQLEESDIIAIMLLIFSYVILAGFFLKHLFLLRKEKFRNRQRAIVALVMFIVLLVTILKPDGLIDFDRLRGKDLLVAERRSTIDCSTTLKLKDNNNFVNRAICFGSFEVKGNYSIKNDTIWFSRVKNNPDTGMYFMYAVFKKSKKESSIIKGDLDLVLYKDKKDTTGRILWITKNDFPL